jgi:hypothetical protein
MVIASDDDVGLVGVVSGSGEYDTYFGIGNIILIIKPRNPRNNRPKFQAKFGVAEEESDGPGEGLVQGLS